MVSAVKVISETDQYHIFQISARVPSDVYWIGPIDFSPWIPGWVKTYLILLSGKGMWNHGRGIIWIIENVADLDLNRFE